MVGVVVGVAMATILCSRLVIKILRQGLRCG